MVLLKCYVAAMRSIESTGKVLTAVYMAWQRAPEANNTGLADIGTALEVALFRRESDWEFHFWTSIEPQLARNTSNVSELYRLENDPQVSTLAGRLSVDWLRAYPELNIHTQTKLLACALKHASDEEKRDLEHIRFRRNILH